MPRTSRISLIKLLRRLISLWLSVPVLRAMVPQLLSILAAISSKRYFASRKNKVKKAAIWDPGFLERIGEVRARRLVRMDENAYSYVVDTLRGHWIFQSLPNRKRKPPCPLSWNFKCS